MRITSAKLFALSEKHYNRFQKFLNSENSPVRPGECQHYSNVWQRAMEWAKSQPDGTVLDREAFKDLEVLNEVLDAHDDGGYEEYFEASA